MFGDRHELDMGEAHIHHIGDQPIRQSIPGEEPVVIVTLPASGMDLIDRDRHAARIDAGPMLEMGLIAPVDLHRMGGEAGGGGAQFAGQSEGVGLQGSTVPSSPVMRNL
jgi:hypothetical protein